VLWLKCMLGTHVVFMFSYSLFSIHRYAWQKTSLYISSSVFCLLLCSNINEPFIIQAWKYTCIATFKTCRKHDFISLLTCSCWDEFLYEQPSETILERRTSCSAYIRWIRPITSKQKGYPLLHIRITGIGADAVRD